MNTTPHLFLRLQEAGIPKEDIDHHESDLYVRVTNKTRQVIEDYCRERNIPVFKTFKSAIEPHDNWYDCPFNYLPFWEERCGQKHQPTVAEIESAYRNLYAYQEEAAEEDYLEHLEANFHPADINWTSSIKSLKECLRSLANEVYDDIGDEDAYNEVLEQCGVTAEMLSA